MNIGCFDEELIFETSDERVLTFSALKRQTSARFQAAEVIGLPPRREYMGPDTSTVTFTILLSASRGVSPDSEAERWLEAAKSGRTGYLVIAGKIIGGAQWSVKKATVLQNAAFADGRSLSATVEITMEEYT